MHPDWEGFAVIDEIKVNTQNNKNFIMAMNADEELEEMVLAFYQTEFWDKLLLNQVTDQDIAGELFDTAVNQGISTAVRQLQQGLNLLNNNQKHYSDLNEDGRMGAETLKAYRAYMLTAHFPGRSTVRNIGTLLKVLNGLQFYRYAEICTANPGQEVYFYGWVNRV
jgi:lysozyme family protein